MRILEVCVDLDGGGIDRYLLNYCSRIKGIQFDFAIVENNKIGILEKEIEALGSRIHRVPRQSHGIRANYQALKKILTENQLWVAGCVGAIAHSIGQMAVAVAISGTPSLAQAVSV